MTKLIVLTLTCFLAACDAEQVHLISEPFEACLRGDERVEVQLDRGIDTYHGSLVYGEVRVKLHLGPHPIASEEITQEDLSAVGRSFEQVKLLQRNGEVTAVYAARLTSQDYNFVRISSPDKAAVDEIGRRLVRCG